MLNIYKLTTKYLTDDHTTIRWCQELGLIPTSKDCSYCRGPMYPCEHDGYQVFRCNRKRHGRSGYQVSIMTGTWFEGIHIPLKKALLLMYAFSNKMSYEDAIRETSLDDEVTSEETICNWYSSCREVCSEAVTRQYTEVGKIGGVGSVVEIDESKIGKRKNNKGRLVEDTWVLGIISLNTNEFRVEAIPANKRDAPTLEALVEKHVALGTTIMTDCWKGYNGLDDVGFEHLTVNHKYHFVDPDTWANTQKIESNWRPLKQRLTRGGVRKDSLGDHLCEYMWMRQHRDEDRFMALLEDIRNMYSA